MKGEFKMEKSLGTRLKHAWNAFRNRDPTQDFRDTGMTYYYRPDRPRFTRRNERTIMTSVLNRIALDASAIDIMHVRLDENGRFLEIMDSGLNNCLMLSANADQTGRALKQDIIMSMLDEGCVAVVPTDTTTDPNKTESYRIDTMRVGKIVQWRPQHVQIRVYNENTGKKEEIWLSKSVAVQHNIYLKALQTFYLLSIFQN